MLQNERIKSQSFRTGRHRGSSPRAEQNTIFKEIYKMATLKALMTSLSKQGLQEQRGEIIYDFTSGRTSSAKELTASEIDELYYELNKRASAKSQELDKKRKRLIAAIFGVFEKMNKKPSIEYVKAIACRAAKEDDFNKIPAERLTSLYNAFLNAQKDLNFAKRLADSLIEETIILN
jgi:hypothetical protein|nr:MAG TPA: Protein of unknown function (DUF1018) [Caudoviricetes sp.]